ncbi:MAG: transglutaminase domain-containing protein [Planctomycetes bacterium]|nr:transglutaminase domain-containing protein [Planctomycetota bacterium]
MSKHSRPFSVVLGAFLVCAISGPVSAQISVGLYKDGQLIETLTEDVLSDVAPRQLHSLADDAPTPLHGTAPAVSAETRARNVIFAEAARLGAQIQETLHGLQTLSAASKAARQPQLPRLETLIQEFSAAQDQARAALDRVGERVLELGLPPEIYQRHLDAVEEFDAGRALFTAAINDVVQDQPGAVEHAVALADQFQFRQEPDLTKAGPTRVPMEILPAPALAREEADALLLARSRQVSDAAQASGGVLQPERNVGLASPHPADLAETPDVQLSAAIRDKAASLGNSPYGIYSFVRNQVAFQPYLGSRKGAMNTLRQRAGNDTDQASLLIALLRAADIPCRYVRGTVELTPDQAKSWLGVDDAGIAGNLLTTAGLDGVNIISGSAVVAIRCTRVWVEAYVPYGNYRGIPNDSSGNIWVPLDPAFQQTVVTPGEDVLSAMGFDYQTFLDGYVASYNSESPLEVLKGDIQTWLDANRPGKTVADIERTVVPWTRELGLLPASLSGQLLASSSPFAALSDADRFKVRFRLYDGGTTFIDYTSNLSDLAGHQVMIHYEGATASDRATIAAHGGVFQTPPNLVRVKPVLKIDGLAVATSPNSIGMGRTHSSDLQFIQPAGGPNAQPQIWNNITAGNSQAIAFDTFLDRNDTFLDGWSIPEGPVADAMLCPTAVDYLNRVDRGEEQANRLLRTAHTVDVSEAIVESSVAVAYSWGGTPQTFAWTGLTVDADRRIIGCFGANGEPNKKLPFMLLTGYDGSFQENDVFEDMYAERAVSTVRILQLSQDQGIPICYISGSIASGCPGFSHSSSVRSGVNNALANGHIVIIPQRAITVGEWSGTGYIDLTPSTGAAAYIISGGISGEVAVAGGTTVDTWSAPLECSPLPNTLEAKVLSPPKDSPDAKALFCEDDSPITFSVALTWQCDRDGDGTADSTESKTLDLTTHHSTKHFGPGDYTFIVPGAKSRLPGDHPRTVTIVSVELQVLDTPADNDDVVQVKCTHPAHVHKVPCRARVLGNLAADVPVVLTNPDGRLRFPYASDTTRALKLPGTGAWSSFQISGFAQSAVKNDAVIEARLNHATGPACGDEDLTVFSFDADSITLTQGGHYTIAGNAYSVHVGSPAVSYASTAKIQPSGLDCTVAHIAGIRMGIMQHITAFEYSITWNTPVIVWEPRVAAGTVLTVPSSIRATTHFGTGVALPVADTEASVRPLYDQPGKTGTLDPNSLKPPVGCAGAAPATSFDTPMHAAPPSFAKEYFDGTGARLATVTWTSRVNTTRDEEFVAFCVAWNTSTREHCALRQAAWSLNVDSAGLPANQHVTVHADAPAAVDPALGPAANSVVHVATDAAVGAATTTFTK